MACQIGRQVVGQFPALNFLEEANFNFEKSALFASPGAASPLYRASMTKKKLATVSKNENRIFKLHVSLPETKPLVWRRVLVPGNFTLEALYSVIQLSMGWQMSHLYGFRIAGVIFTEPGEFDMSPPMSVDTSLSVALADHSSFIYDYDFGDDWQHSVTVEAIEPLDEVFNYPICINGANACPPEDCGGFGGFENLKKTISDPQHPEYRETMMWIGGHFDPFSFDPNRINRDLLWVTRWQNGPDEQGLYHRFKFEDD